MENKKALGHVLAIFTIFIWGTTFISTKILLQAFQPVEILFFRFVMGYILLWIMNPHRLPIKSWKQELTFAGAARSSRQKDVRATRPAPTCGQAQASAKSGEAIVPALEP